MFLLLGILTWLRVRVPRGSFGYLSQIFDRKKGVQSTEAQRIARDTEFPMALFPPAHIKALCVRILNFSLSVLKKKTSKAWMWYEMQTLSVQIQYAEFLLFIVVFPSAVMIKAVTPWVRKSEMFQSDLTSRQGLKLTELLIQIGASKSIS